ncbi:MAG: baeRF12 domain-containing protein [Croceibacterium sp.]
MKIPHMAHVALVDGEHFRLLRNTGQIFEAKLELVAEPKIKAFVHGGGTSDDRGGLSTAGAHADLPEIAHGAAVAEWLNAKALAGEIEQLVIVADPRTLGEMRPHFHKVLQARIVAEVTKDLIWESPHQVAQSLAAA